MGHPTYPEKLTINRSDWSGNTVDIMVNRDAKTFALMDYAFRLEQLTGPDYEIIEKEFGEIAYTIGSADGEWTQDYSLGTVWVKGEEANASSLGITRDDRDVFVAAAQLLCNTI